MDAGKVFMDSNQGSNRSQTQQQKTAGEATDVVKTGTDVGDRVQWKIPRQKVLSL